MSPALLGLQEVSRPHDRWHWKHARQSQPVFCTSKKSAPWLAASPVSCPSLPAPTGTSAALHPRSDLCRAQLPASWQLCFATLGARCLRLTSIKSLSPLHTEEPVTWMDRTRALQEGAPCHESPPSLLDSSWEPVNLLSRQVGGRNPCLTRIILAQILFSFTSGLVCVIKFLESIIYIPLLRPLTNHSLSISQGRTAHPQSLWALGCAWRPPRHSVCVAMPHRGV